MTRLALLPMLLLTLVGCNPGPYPTDIYPEMHYSSVQRRGEPTRLSPGSDAVPVSGGRPRYSFAEAAALVPPASTSANGITVYAVNCAMCHGADGHGHSVVGDQFAAAGTVPPVDLTGDRVRQRTDGQLWWLIANGIGNMPAFSSLLTEDEMWALVRSIRALQ